MTGNKKSFNITSVSLKAFSIILDNFDAAVTFFFRIKEKIHITIVSSALSKTTSNILIKRIKTIVSSVKIIGRQVQSIAIKPVKISTIIKEIGKVSLTTNLKKVGFVIVSRARGKILSNITIKKIKFNFIGLYGTFYTLGLYDPQTLGTLDSKTLGEMDFTVIP